MRKIAEKIAIVAQICIALIFILITTLYMTNVIPQTERFGDNGIFSVVTVVMSVLYLAVSAYVLYVNFSETANIKRILLFCDSDSATHATAKVINKIVKDCAKQADGVKIRKIRIRSDEKAGFIATVNVVAQTDNVSQSVNSLRLLLSEGFENTLGLKFNTVNFRIVKLQGKYLPDGQNVQHQAEILQQEQQESSENYHNPSTPQNNTHCAPEH